jgi:spore germination protein KB
MRLNPKQLISIIMLFEIGTTTLFAFGISAKQDAWIAVMISTLGALAMLWIWLEIQKNYPDKNWVEILNEVLGKWLGIPLVIMYMLYWNHIACFNLSEFGDLMTLTFLTSTPKSVIFVPFVLVSSYILILGLNVFGRTCEFILPFMLIMLFTSYLLLFISGEMHFNQLLPIMGDGPVPVLKAAHPIIGFPFGESCVLLMYWKYVHPKESIRKASFWAVGISGLVITLSVFSIISVLGAEYAANMKVPLVSLIRLINVGNIITHLDLFGTIIIFWGALFKMMIFIYAGVRTICTIFKIQNEHPVIWGIGIFNFIYSLFYFPSMEYHRFVGFTAFVRNMSPIFGWTLPTMILLILWLKKWHQKNYQT